MEDEMRITIIATGFDEVSHDFATSGITERGAARPVYQPQPAQPGGGGPIRPAAQTAANPNKPTGTQDKNNASGDAGDIDDFDSVMDLLKPNKRNLYDE